MSLSNSLRISYRLKPTILSENAESLSKCDVNPGTLHWSNVKICTKNVFNRSYVRMLTKCHKAVFFARLITQVSHHSHNSYKSWQVTGLFSSNDNLRPYGNEKPKENFLNENKHLFLVIVIRIRKPQ